MKQCDGEIPIGVFVNRIFWHEARSSGIVNLFAWSIFGWFSEGNHGVCNLLCLDCIWLAVNRDTELLSNMRRAEIAFLCLSRVNKSVDKRRENRKHFLRCLQSCSNEFLSLELVDFGWCAGDDAQFRDKI